MKLRDTTRAGLIDFTVAQTAHLLPDGREVLRPQIAANIDEALDRLSKCINAVRFWPPDEFYYLHSSQYCTYLYYLANTIWRNTADAEASSKLFLLNKALNGIDLFYEIQMPDIFFIGHSAGIVLAKAQYSDYLVLYQNSTVGKNHSVAPVLEAGVVMYPNTAIIGRTIVRRNTVLSQGSALVNHDSPGDVMVFRGPGAAPVFKPLKRNILADLFRI